jgi:hypothetical protein
MTREEIHKLPWKAQEYINKLERKLTLTDDVKSDSEQLTKIKRECECSGMSYKVKCGFKCHK